MKQKILKENLIKNLIVLIALVIFYSPLVDFLQQLPLRAYDSITLVSTVLIMAFLFADYAFTYSAADIRSTGQRFLGHLITAIILFGTGALLQISILSLNLSLQTRFCLMEILGWLFYASLVLYDFWDLNRGMNKL